MPEYDGESVPFGEIINASVAVPPLCGAPVFGVTGVASVYRVSWVCWVR
jgi:hypothetical protein